MLLKTTKTIAAVSAKKIYDSRGEETIEIALTTGGGDIAFASVPQGRSRGSYEAAYVAPDRAIQNIRNILHPALAGKALGEQETIDAFLIEQDGTPTKSRLGANTLLGVSLAYARASARAEGMPLWRFIERAGHFPHRPLPRLFINLINGGLHAQNNLDIQEYLVIPRTTRPSEALAQGNMLYADLKERFGPDVPIGDEGGVMPNFQDNVEPFAVLRDIIWRRGYDVDFGIDAAATNIKKTPDELARIYRELKERCNLFYLEDPFGENDFEQYASLTEEFGRNMKIAGDDLTTTNLARMETAREKGSINSVIIKPNQIGTLSETISAVQKAREWGWYVVVSHRSGETNDDWIADVAVGTGADGFKLGAPHPPERLAKYHRLLDIELKEK